MKRCLFPMFFVLFCLFACKKNENKPVENTNEIKATVILYSGDTITIDTKGINAEVGCGFFSGFYLEAVNEKNQSIVLSLFDTLLCPPPAGVYSSLMVTYYTNNTKADSPTYNNIITDSLKTDHLTVSVSNGGYLEGHFEGLLEYADQNGVRDTAIVTGTFKGKTGN